MAINVPDRYRTEWSAEQLSMKNQDAGKRSDPCGSARAGKGLGKTCP